MLSGSGMNEPAVKIESLSRDERLDLLEGSGTASARSRPTWR
jgi:hypothetical protein